MLAVKVQITHGRNTGTLYAGKPRGRNGKGWDGYGFQLNLFKDTIYAAKMAEEEQAEELADLVDLFMSHTMEDPTLSWEIEVVDI